MNFVTSGDFSTGAGGRTVFSLKDAVNGCIVPETGELLMPERIPVIPRAYLNNMPGMNLREIAFVIMRQFFDDIPSSELNDMVRRAFAADIPLVPLPGVPGVWLEEMFHGPTLSFKDYGAAMQAELMAYFDRQEAKSTLRTVLVATTGNAGMAAAEAMRALPGTRTLVLYPRLTLPKLHQRFLGAMGPTVIPVEVDGNIDQCRALVKGAMADRALGDSLRLTGGNSINIARLLPQITFFFHAVASLRREGSEKPVEFFIPTGNMSNLVAAAIAVRMGLPVQAIYACGNSLDIPGRIFRGQGPIEPSQRSYAPALTVGLPTNYCRLLALGDFGGLIRATSASDADIARVVRMYRNFNGVGISPHTAAALLPAIENPDPDTERIVLATEHPAKSLETMTAITGSPVELPFQIMRLYKASTTRPVHMAPTLPALVKTIENL